MALNPHPSLATIAPNGTFTARTVYASTLPGVVLDCVLSTGLTAAGGAPHDNAAAINAVLATATASRPLHLVIDGGSAIGAPLVIAADNTTITFPNRACGLFVLAGSNCSAIQNYDHTNLAEYLAWNPTGAQSVTMSNVAIRGGYICGNRGTYPSGNCNGAIDHTLDSYTPTGTQKPTTVAPDARGAYTSAYWLSGIALVGVDNLMIEDVDIHDTPSYHINLYGCPRHTIRGCRLTAADPANQPNTDGIHLNGGCSHGHISDISGSVGDDLVAVNLHEGDGTGGGDLVISGLHATDTLCAVRLYGDGVATRRIFISDVVMEGCFGQAVLIGAGSPSGSGTNLSVWISGVDFDCIPGSGPNSVVRVVDHVGMLHLDRVAMASPRKAIPLVSLGLGATVGSLVARDLHIHRDAAGHAAAYAFAGTSGSVGLLTFEGLRVTDAYGTTNADIPILVDLTGTTVGRLRLSGDLAGVSTVVSVPSGASVPAVVLGDLVHVSRGGSARTIASDSATAIHLHNVSTLGSGVSALAGGTGTITATGAALVAL